MRCTVNTPAHGAAIPVNGGGWLHLEHLQPEEITIEMIASGLAGEGRWNNQCRRFYSVAEHSVRTSLLVPDEFRLHALLHDAPEGLGLRDLARFLKYLDGMEVYREINQRFHRVVWDRFQLGRGAKPQRREITSEGIRERTRHDLELALERHYAIPECVELAEKRLTTNELRDLFDGHEEGVQWRIEQGWDLLPHYQIGCPLEPAAAKSQFLHRYYEIVNAG